MEDDIVEDLIKEARRYLGTPLSVRLSLQEPSLQQCLHVTTAIGNYQNVHIFGNHPIDDTIGFEKNLTVLAKSDGK